MGYLERAEKILAEIRGRKTEGKRWAYERTKEVPATIPFRDHAHNDRLTPDDLPEYWREAYEERAGMLEFGDGHPRPEAERQALAIVRDQMDDHAHRLFGVTQPPKRPLAPRC